MFTLFQPNVYCVFKTFIFCINNNVDEICFIKDKVGTWLGPKSMYVSRGGSYYPDS